MPTTATFFAVRAPVRARVAQVRPLSLVRPLSAPKFLLYRLKIGFIDVALRIVAVGARAYV